MSHQLDLAERFLHATSEGDAGALDELVVPDAVWDFSRSRGPYTGVYTGREEIATLLESYREAWAQARFETVSTYGRGDWMAHEIRVRGRGYGSALDVDARGAWVYAFRDGRLAGLTMFQSMHEAREFVDAQP